jgi:phenylalanyl-tRNA synthetase beta chain
MKYSLNWLKELVDIPCEAQELADKLSAAGLEVEGLELIGSGLKGIVTGKIQSITKHPDADKLLITQIFDGTTTHQIVTGAQNVFEGAIVPASLPGAVLANGTVIKNGVLRGVESNGMLCSEVELGVAEESQGIWILPEDTPLGVDFVEYAGLSDALLDLNILPNRGDCQSMLGLAREVAAIFDTSIRYPATDVKTTPSTSLTIRVDTPELCPLYTARTITNIQGKTPFLMQRRLQLCGIRSINLAVDITNYVMLECGQPLHAFDAATLPQNTIIVRCAAEGEAFETLDHQALSLASNHLVIADSSKPIALAGVMGGASTGVSESTTSVILESAYFDPGSVRKTRTVLGLRTESAVRFEKAVDINGVTVASNRAAFLFQTLGNAGVSEITSITHQPHPVFSSTVIPFNPNQINAFLGSSFSEDAMRKSLESLGFTLENGQAKVPSWRQNDCSEWPCLAEEIARKLGFDNITDTLPRSMVPVAPVSPFQQTITTLETYLLGVGFQQFNTFPMTSEADFNKTGSSVSETVYTLKNPLTPEHAYMRQDLLPLHLGRHQYNQAHSVEPFNSFEIGKTYFNIDNTLVEKHQLCVVMTQSYFQGSYTAVEKSAQTLGFAELKGLAETLLDTINPIQISFQPTTNKQLHPVQSADVYSGKTLIGTVGFLHPKIAHAYDLTGAIGVISLDITQLVAAPKQRIKIQPISKFPAVKRDMALLVPKSLPFQELLGTIKKHKSSLLKDIQLFDYFESEKLGPDHKSLALRFTYHHAEKTLTDADVQTAHQALCEHITKSLPVSIR